MEGEGRGGAIAPERRGLCAGGESNAASCEAPPLAPALVPPPGRRRLPRRPVLAAAGPRWGAASRRFGGGWAEPARDWATSRVSLAPRGACLYAAFPLPAPGSSGGRDRYSPSQISPERKLGAVSRKGAFMAELGGTWVHKTGSQEPSGLSECLLLQEHAAAGEKPGPGVRLHRPLYTTSGLFQKDFLRVLSVCLGVRVVQ